MRVRERKAEKHGGEDARRVVVPHHEEREDQGVDNKAGKTKG